MVHPEPLRQATFDIAGAIRRAEQRRRRRAQVATPIRVIDGLLEELEQMNLSNRRRVPMAWDARLQLLNRSVPLQARRDLRGNISPNRLMDMLYEMQGELLALKIGRLRDELVQIDEELDALDVA